MLTWNTVLDNVFSSHLRAFADEACPGHASQIVSQYHGVEDDTLVLPEKLKNPLNAPPTGLRWMKSRMESLLEEQDEGIQDKMVEVKMYTDMLEKLKKANGVPGHPSPDFRVSGIGDPELGIQNKLPNPESQNSELGTRVSRTRYSGQSIKLRVMNFGTQDSGVWDWIFRTKYRAPSYKLRTPNFGARDLTEWDYTPLALFNFSSMSAYIYSGQSIELRVTNPEPRTPNFRARDSGVRDSIFRTVLSSELQTPNPERQSSGLGIQNEVSSSES
ncbi:hypothetical protein BDR05DRAFT_952532 [Suillus weaverae]|nr:hypothetical protein BDR05DRAFT_952532 [Suillus weaverae]